MILDSYSLSLVVIVLLLCSVCSAGEEGPVKSLLPKGCSWSGSSAVVSQGSDGLLLTARFERQAAKDSVSSVSASWEPVDLKTADVLEIRFTVSRPVRSVRIVLTDKDGVGADNCLAGLQGLTSLEARRTYRVLWPYRYKPGWVRYGRTRVRWDAISGISFYVGESDLDSPLDLKLTSMKLKTFEDLEKEGITAALSVIEDDDTLYLLQRYFVARAKELTDKAHKRWIAQRSKSTETIQDEVRRALLRTFFLPPDEGPSEAISLGFVEIDRIKVEKRLIRTRPGVYVTCQVYFPPDLKGKAPGLLVLPGHGNQEWESGVQELGLGFAKAGFVAYFVQPFGQGQRRFNPMRNELLGNMSTGILIAAGQSLLGLIIDERRRVLDDMQSRPEIDPERLAVTGVSMGGTHSLWLGAVDLRLKVVVSDAAAYFWRPQYCYCHHSIADLMIGQFLVGDEELIDALIAPRTLVRIYPDSEPPIPYEAAERFREGWLTFESLMKQKPLSEREALEQHFPFTRSVFKELGAESELAVEIVPGPHTYNKEMREVAVGWLNHVFQGSRIGLTSEEPPLNPIPNQPAEKHRKAKDKLYCWPDGKRSSGFLDPGRYALRVIQKKIERLPEAPSSARDWRTMKQRILAGVRRCAGTRFEKFSARAAHGRVTDLPDRTLARLVVEPEKGIKVPVLVVTPKSHKKPNPLLVYLSPDGLAAAASSPRLDALIRRGWNVAFVDLRGIGETRPASESGGYIGFRDWDLCNTSLRLGDTLAGLWARDLLATLAVLRGCEAFKNARFSIWAEKETGFPAVLAGATVSDIDSIVLEGFLASYDSPRGYGGIYIYRDENGRPVKEQPTLSYGSAVPWIPNLLDFADIPHLLSLCAPKRLLMLAPTAADGKPDADAARYDWTRQAYSFENPGGFSRKGRLPDDQVLDWLDWMTTALSAK